MINKSFVLGGLLPLLLVATGVGVFVGLRPETPSTVEELGSDRASLLSVMPAAEVQQVRALAELSETLDIPVSGTVVPFREIELAAEAAGKIIEKDPNVRSGNFVRKDQVLLRIDPRDYELEIERLTRRRDQELASLTELKQDVENIQRLIEVAEQEFDLATSELRRFESLGPNITSAAELDQAKRAQLVSINQKVTMQNELRSLEARGSRLELAAKLAETELEQAALNLERTVVRAPVDGRIVSEQVEKDSYVQRGTPLLVIEDTEKVEVAVNLKMNQLYWILDQNDVSTDRLVNAAQASRYELPPVPVKVQFNLAGRESMSYEWDGVLDRYDGPGMDPQSRTVPIRVVVDRPAEYRIDGKPVSAASRAGPSTLSRGMFVDVKVQARPATQLLLVPKLSIKPATSSNRIWKFVPDERAFEVVKKKFIRSVKEPDNDAQPPSGAEVATVDTDREVIDPAQWQAGFLQVLEGVQVVGAFEPESSSVSDAQFDELVGAPDDGERIEYWICEVTGGGLAVGDLVVVTPLPGIAGDGTDAIRVSRKSTPPQVHASKSPSSTNN